MLKADERKNEDGKKTLQEGIEQLKIDTRRYARKQRKWIMNRFLGRTDRQVCSSVYYTCHSSSNKFLQVPPVYALDSTHVEQWHSNVSNPAFEIINSYLNGTDCTIQALPLVTRESLPNSMDDSFFCETCQRVFVGNHQWNIHRKSTKHKKMVERRTKSVKSKGA